jgi:hypothetical protein
MFGLDAFALTYGGALALTGVIALAVGGCARGKGVILLGAAWLMTLVIQRVSGELAAPLTYAWLDFALVATFSMIALFYNRAWAWWVAGFHIAMMFSHLAYVWSGEISTFAYLSVLAGLGYLSMGAIVGPPLLELIRGGSHETLDYRRFMRGGNLPPSAFEAKGKKPGGEA